MRLLIYCLSICVVGFNANAVQSAEDPSLQSTGLELRFVGTEMSSLFSHKAVTDDGETIYLSSEPTLTVADVESVTFTRVSNGGTDIILALESDAIAEFSAATKANVGNRLALVLNGKVVAAPQLRSPLTSLITLSGNFSDKTVTEIFAASVLAKKPKSVDAESLESRVAQPANSK